MRTASIASVVVLAAGSPASASFTGFLLTSTSASVGGQALQILTLSARFSGPTDTVLNVFNFHTVYGAPSSGYWHKDFDTSDVLTQSAGTWNPTMTGSAFANRPYDSYLTIGGLANATNSTAADPSWNWSGPDLPSSGTIGWYNSSPQTLQGRVGNSPGLPATDVRLGQFVRSDGVIPCFELTIGYTDGIAGSPVQFASGISFCPTPAPLALLGLAGLVRRRRR